MPCGDVVSVGKKLRFALQRGKEDSFGSRGEGLLACFNNFLPRFYFSPTSLFIHGLSLDGKRNEVAIFWKIVEISCIINIERS